MQDFLFLQVSMAYTLSFIGSGNVASQLARSFQLAGHKIDMVCSRNAVTGKELASRVGAMFVSDPAQLSSGNDFIFICVQDDEIANVSAQIPKANYTVLHTSGSTELQVLQRFDFYGVCYPLQTFSKGREVRMQEVPVAIEASEPAVLRQLQVLAESISGRVVEVSSAQRLYLHLAAVVTNNFTNYLFQLADDLLKEKNMSLDLLGPLMRETVEKAIAMGPAVAQTGPAKRKDVKLMQKHLALLGEGELAALYRLISEGIGNTQGG